MKNYTISPISSPKGFALKDENGNTVGFVLDEGTAQVFAHVPELLKILDACAEDNTHYPFLEAEGLREKLKQYRP